VVAKRTLEDGIAILRFVAESDAVKHVRERIRDGASRVADNDRVPRIIAGSAGILAALLSEADEQEPEPDFTYDPSQPANAGSGVRVPSIPPEEDDEDDDDEDMEEFEDLATVRDLEDEADLASPPDGDAEELDDDEEQRLPYEEHDEIGEGEFMAGETKEETKQATPKRAAKKKGAGKASKSANAARGAEKKAAGKRGRSGRPVAATPAAAPAPAAEPTAPTKAKRKSTAKPKVVKRPTEKAARRTEPPTKKSS
jgi:hypothetical protein